MQTNYESGRFRVISSTNNIGGVYPAVDYIRYTRNSLMQTKSDFITVCFQLVDSDARHVQINFVSL